MFVNRIILLEVAIFYLSNRGGLLQLQPSAFSIQEMHLKLAMILLILFFKTRKWLVPEEEEDDVLRWLHLHPGYEALRQNQANPGVCFSTY